MDEFTAFYRHFEPAVLRLMLRRTSDPELAADLAAETFAAALAAWIDRVPPEHVQAPWIFSIARSKLIDSYRRGQVADAARRELGMQPLMLEDPDLERVEHLDDTALTALLQSLPDDQREAVQARVLDERQYDEIAVELRCSAQVVRKRVSRGLAHLRRQAEGTR